MQGRKEVGMVEDRGAYLMICVAHVLCTTGIKTE